jgi:sensor histidine kinase YesM
VTLRARRNNGRLSLEVADDGVGIPEGKREDVFDSGIGITNVRERLKVLYGQEFSLEIESRPGQGTSIRIDIPEILAAGRTPVVEPAHTQSR